MPVNPSTRSFALDGRFTSQDYDKLKWAVVGGSVSPAEAKEVLSHYAELMDPEVQAQVSEAFGIQARARQTSFPEGFTDQTFMRGDRSDDVRTLQRSLMSTALSSQIPGMALKGGADGIFGPQTENALKAFQRANGFVDTGVAGPITLKALEQAMAGTQPTASRPTTPSPLPAPTVVPSTGLRRAPIPAEQSPLPTTTLPPAPLPIFVRLSPGTSAATVDAATKLATGPRAPNYGFEHPWRNTDPQHAAPVDVRMGGLTDRWKCNLFGGNALADAGFEPPYYGNKGGGEYPVAEQWHQWSSPTPEARQRAEAEGQPIPNYATQHKNPSRFDLTDQVQLSALPSDDAKRRRIQQLLDRVQPGDVLTADHADSGADGGHVRVCVGRDPVTRQPRFAQAGQGREQERAHIETEGPDEMMDEKALYILRPNTPRIA